MQNNERYQNIKKMILSSNPELTESDISLYADMVDIIKQLINNKLSDDLIITTFDLLSDVILGKGLYEAIRIPRKEKIKIQLKMMEKFICTRVLSAEEREIFAFCVWQASCIMVYDEKTNTSSSALVTFTSVDRIRKEYEFCKKTLPFMFEFKKQNNL